MGQNTKNGKSAGKPVISRFEGLWRDINKMTKILFVCHGNMLRSIPIGLNVCEKNTRKALKNHDWQKNWNCLIIKVQKRQFTPVSGFQRILTQKIVTFASEAGDYFFVPIIITISTPNAIIKESVSYVLMLYHHHLGDGSHPAVGTACFYYIRGKRAVNRKIKKKPLFKAWTYSRL